MENGRHYFILMLRMFKVKVGAGKIKYFRFFSSDEVDFSYAQFWVRSSDRSRRYGFMEKFGKWSVLIL